ncbi:UNVERIFIED_CONTAM: hypothetical protein Sindi_1427000 [Sesamum indicum]
MVHVILEDDVGLEYYKFCGELGISRPEGKTHAARSPRILLRYLPLTPRLQKLYFSRATVEHMTWHATHSMEEELMCHPSDAKAWKNFDRMYPDFVEESHNVRLGLCTNDFAPHHKNKKAFTKNRVEHKVAHPRLTGNQILDGVADISPAVDTPFRLW